ncbi:MAG: tetratricopeptide repeat protein [Sandaracinaceae bacterium]
MRSAAIIALSVSLLLASAARAQDGEVDPVSEQATRRFEEGVVALRAERYQDAAVAFRESYRLDPRVETMCNLALTYDRSGPENRHQALRAYRTCARDDTTGRYAGYAQQRVGEIERALVLEEQPAGSDPDGDASPEESEAAPAEDAGPVDDGPIGPLEPVPETTASEPDHTVMYLGFGVAGLAAIAFGVAIGCGVESTRLANDLVERLGPMPTIVRGSADHDQLRDAEELADVSNAMYIAGGALTLTSIVMIIVDIAIASAPGPRTAVAIGPGSLTVRF